MLKRIVSAALGVVNKGGVISAQKVRKGKKIAWGKNLTKPNICAPITRKRCEKVRIPNPSDYQKTSEAKMGLTKVNICAYITLKSVQTSDPSNLSEDIKITANKKQPDNRQEPDLT